MANAAAHDRKTAYGSASMWGELERVLVRRPLGEDAAGWEAYGWHAAPDTPAAQAEHEALCALLEENGAEVVVSEHDPGNPDATSSNVYEPDAVAPLGICVRATCPRTSMAGPSPAAVTPAFITRPPWMRFSSPALRGRKRPCGSPARRTRNL